MQAAIRADLPLRSREKFLFITLCWRANLEDVCWHSQATLARDTSMSERAIRTYLAKLESLSLIRRHPRFGGGHRITDLIEVLFKPANPASLPSVKPANLVVHTGKNVRFKPADFAGEEDKENLKERRAGEARDVETASPALEPAEAARLMRELLESMKGRSRNGFVESRGQRSGVEPQGHRHGTRHDQRPDLPRRGF